MYFVRDGDELVVADAWGYGIVLDLGSGVITHIGGGNVDVPDNFKDYCFGQFVFVDGNFKWVLNEDLPIGIRSEPAPRPSHVPEMKMTVNALRADAQRGQNYGGKIIELEGKVYPVGRVNGKGDTSRIALEGVWPAEITCIPVWSDRSKFRQLQTGQQVRVVGRIKKLDSRSDGSMDQCIITEVGPIPGK